MTVKQQVPLDQAVADITPSRRNITWALVIIVFALNYVDRQAFGIFIPAIKADLGVSDQVMGLIAGLGFAIFYVVGAFPIARYADRGDRPLAIGLCVAVWSLATAACGLAANAWQLALIRIGLAAGEGGASPACQSLLLEVLGPKRRTIVLATMLAASSFGLGAGVWLGGFLSQYYNWRVSLAIIGLPGLLVALGIWLFAVEPRRASADAAGPSVAPIPVRDVVSILLGSASMRWIALTLISFSVAGFPFVIWMGAFLQNVHGMNAHEAGSALFLPLSGGLIVGNLTAGWLGDRVGGGRPIRLAVVAMIGPALAFFFGVGAAQASSSTVALICFFFFQALLTIHLAPMQALAFAQVPVTMRATLGASMNMVMTLCGLGIGTWMVGALSDFFAADYGDMSLRYALTAVCLAIPFGMLAAFLAGRRAQLDADA